MQLVVDPIIPNAQGAAALDLMIEHIENDGTDPVLAWLEANNLTKDTDIVSIWTPWVGGEEKARRLLYYIFGYSFHGQLDKCLELLTVVRNRFKQLN